MLNVQFPVFPQIQTSRCLLRQVTMEDAPQFFQLRSDEKVMRYIDRDRWNSVKEAEEMIGNIQGSFKKGEGISWVVCLKEENAMIGFAGLWRIIREHYRAEIGYSLLPAYWNKGLMSEVIAEIVDFGFRDLGLHSIEANINPGNHASRRTLEKNGFVQEAYFKENYYYNGKFLDSVILSRLGEGRV